MILRGKMLAVTGGNSGIGGAIVRTAAAEGANVAVDNVADPEDTQEIVAAIEQLGGHAVVTKADDLHKIVRAAVDTYGRLDVLITNAGIETRTGILDTNVACCVPWAVCACWPAPRASTSVFIDGGGILQASVGL